MPVIPRRSRAIAGAAALAFLGQSIHAATVTWDAGAGTNAWSTPTNWDTNLEPTIADDVVLAAGLAATLTLSTGEVAKSLQFDDDYTLSSGGLTLASASTIGVLLGENATISTALTITGGTTKTGGGTLTLSGTNTFTGGVTVSAGTLRVANTGGIGAITNVATVNAGATLEVAGGIALDRSITLNNGGTVAGSGAAISNGKITFDTLATGVTFATTALADVFTIGNGANDVTGGSAATTIAVTGPGTVRLGAASDFSGSWNIGAGSRLELGATAALGTAAAGGVTLSGGALAGRLTVATTFTGPTNLTLTASSSLISDRSSPSGGVAYTFGTVAMGTHTLTVAPGANATTGTAAIVVGNVTLSGDATFAVNDAAASGKLTTGSLLGGGIARTLAKTGNGDLVITGGATDLIAGSTFTVSGGGNIELRFPTLGAGATIAVTNAQHPLGAAVLSETGGTLNLLADGDGTTAVQNFVLANGMTLGGDITLDPNRLTISSSNTNKVLDVPALTLAAGAVVNMAGDNTYGVRVTGATTLQGNVTLQGTALAGRDGRLTFNGAIGDGGSGYSVSIAGGASTLNLTLNAASTYSGGTNVSGGNVTLNSANALGTGPLAQTGGTVTANAAGAVADTLTLSAGSFTANFNGAIGGAILLSGGTLRANGIGALAGNTIALNGGTLDLRTNVTATFTTGPITLGGDATMNFANNGSGSSQIPTFGNAVNVSGNRTLTITNANSFQPNFASIALAGDLTLNSAISVSVQAISQDATPRRFIKAGTGTTTLTGTGTFTGGAEVIGGILLINDTSALGSSVLTVGDISGVATATAQLGVGPSLTNNIVVRAGSSGAATLRTAAAGFTWAGNVSLQRTGTLEATTGTTTFGGVLSGVGNVIKTGNGEIILGSAANTFGNGTAASININAGTLTVATDGALGNAANGVTIGTALTFRADGTFSTARTITPGGAAANIDVTSGNTLTLNSALGGNVAFEKEGLGTLAFGPGVTSTRTAITTINDGTLRLSEATSLGIASPISFTTATLDLRNDASTNYAHPLTMVSGTNTINVDRAVGGSATGGMHTVGTIALAALTLNTTGSNGFGLATGSVSTTGNSTLNHDAPGALTVASYDLGGTSGTFTFTQDGDGGDATVTGAIAETGTPVYNFTKRGSHTLHLGTAFTTRGTLTVVDGTLDLNNLNVALNSTLTIGGSGLNTAASIVTGTGSLTLGGTLTYAINSALPPANITGNLNLGAATRTFTINDNLSAPTDLDIIGAISGPATIGFTKGGTGTLRLSGAGNTFTGLATIQAGAVELNKSSGDAIGIGGLTINTTATTTVRLIAPDQINDAAVVNVTNTAGTARLDLGGFSETVGATAVTATTTSGALITTGAAGSLVLGGDLTLANNFSSTSVTTTPRRVLITGTGTSTTAASDGVLNLGGGVRNIAVTTTVVGANSANANAVIETAIVTGGINKTGPQTLYLTNAASTFAGGLNIADGIVDVSVAGAAGVGPITFNNTATSALRLSTNGMTLANSLVVSAAGVADAKLTYSGGIYSTATMTGAITLERNLIVDVVTGLIDQSDGDLFGRLVLTGNIDDGAGTFSIVKRGNGFLSLTGLNTHGGGVIIEKGTLAITADASLGATGAPLTFAGGALFAEGSISTPRNLVFTSAGSVHVETPDVLELAGNITTGGNDMGFFGAGRTILSGTGGGGSGRLIVGKYASDFADPGTGTPQIEFGHVLSLRSGFALPTGNIWLLNGGVLELGAGDFTRSVGSGAGEVRMETYIGAGFAAFGANRTVNLGGAGATLIFGDPVTKFLRALVPFGAFESPGALILGSATATHTVDFQNPLEFNNGDLTNSRTITVPDGPAAKEAILSGDLSLNGLPGTTDIFLELNIEGALEITGDISGSISLYKYSAGSLTLTGTNTFDGTITVDGGLLNIDSDDALGDPANSVSVFNGSTLQAGGDITSNRSFNLSDFGNGASIIDTNGHDVTLDTGSVVFGNGSEVHSPVFLEKIGAGTLTLKGTLNIDGLLTSAGTTNLDTALGTGTSILEANAETIISADQVLEELIIGDGAVVTLSGDAPAPAPFQAVPEPGIICLMAAGLAALFRRRRS